MANTENVSKSEKVKKPKRKVNPNSLANLRTLKKGDPRAKELAALSVYSKQRMAELRKAAVMAIAEARPKDLHEQLWRAAMAGDEKKVNCIRTVMTLYGASFDQSEEKIQNLKITQNTTEKRNIQINFRPATPEDAK